MPNLIASFWQYQGNHPNGQNCVRRDPHDFGIDLIGYLAYCSTSETYQFPLTAVDFERVVIIKHTSEATSFGQNITVKAPLEIWQKARKALDSITLD